MFLYSMIFSAKTFGLITSLQKFTVNPFEIGTIFIFMGFGSILFHPRVCDLRHIEVIVSVSFEFGFKSSSG